MKNYGDPQSQMCCISGFLSEVYHDTRLMNLTIGKPKPGNLAQIHDKVIKKLECMAHANSAMPASVGTPYPSVVRLQPYTRCTLWRSYELPALSLP